MRNVKLSTSANVTSFSASAGLKHVSDDQKTHKNPGLRSQTAAVKTKSPERVNLPKAAAPKKTPLLELEGKKWRVVRVSVDLKGLFS